MIRGLLIRPEWVDKILAGKKKWEMRGSRTHIRGTVGLIPSGSGRVVGVCDVVCCVGPLSLNALRRNARKAGYPPSEVTRKPYPKTYAWVLDQPKRLKKAVRYKHHYGAIIEVRLTGKTEQAIRKAPKTSATR